MDRHCTWKVRAEGGMARRRAWLLSALLVLGMTSAAQAAARPELSLGLRYGEGAVYGDHEQFEGQELFLRAGPPAWRELWPAVRAEVEFAGARFRNGGDKALAVMAGPVLVWQRAGRPWALEGGIRLTWLSDDVIGDRDLGGKFQFTSYVAAVWQLSPRLAAALRLQHTSNAGIYNENPGLDLQLIELRFRF